MHLVNLESLESKWATTIYNATGDAPERGAQWFKFLVEAYSESHRHYHTLEHVKHVLADIAFLSQNEPVNDDLLTCLELSAWFHDVVFDPRSESNELDSTDLAEKALCDLGVDSRLIDQVIELILVTHSHRPTTVGQRIFSDADFGIFATTNHIYKAYAYGIKKEYNWMSPEGYRLYRISCLKSLLNRDDIFYTSTMQSYENHARYNINSELIGMKYV